MEKRDEFHASTPISPTPYTNLIRGYMGHRDGMDVSPLPPALQQNKSLGLSTVRGPHMRIAGEILKLNEEIDLSKRGINWSGCVWACMFPFDPSPFHAGLMVAKVALVYSPQVVRVFPRSIITPLIIVDIYLRGPTI